MSLYLVKCSADVGTDDFVEAGSFGEALKLWTDVKRNECDSIELVSEGKVIRGEPDPVAGAEVEP